MLIRRLLRLALLAPALAGAAPLALPLAQVERSAQDTSHALKAAALELKAAQESEAALFASLFPRLGADAAYRYNAAVPSVKLSPQAPALKFGDNHNYSVGLAATWTIDGGAAIKAHQASKAATQSRAEELAFQRIALRLRARLAYFQTQLAATRVRLLADATRLAQSQAADLGLRLKAGSSSRIDALSASNEELSRRSLFRQARADLAASLRDLFALSGEGAGADPSLPLADAMGDSLPVDIEAPSLIVALDPLAGSLAALSPAARAAFKPREQARMRALLALAQGAREAVGVAWAGHLPKLNLGARWSLDYPNGPVLESVEQKSASASLNLPLWSWGMVGRQVASQEALAAAAGERALALEADQVRDWAKGLDRLRALEAQRGLAGQGAAQAASLSELVYKAYKVGGVSYLEVQSASLKALEAGIQLAVTETQMLIELAALAALAE